jgi:uracil phosphoribosyltransferase
MIHLIDNVIAQEKLTQIRTKGIDKKSFREGIKEIGHIISYEFAETLETKGVVVETPLGKARGVEIIDREDIVIISILRAAIPLSMSVLDVFPDSNSGFAGEWREDEPPFNVNMDYIKLPDLTDKIVIIPDPMLATGNSMHKFLDKISKLEKYGKPRRLVFFSVISAKEGIERLQKNYPEMDIYTCTIEDEINEKGYIVPGLGDAGDLSFGQPL